MKKGKLKTICELLDEGFVFTERGNFKRGDKGLRPEAYHLLGKEVNIHGEVGDHYLTSLGSWEKVFIEDLGE